MTDLLNEPCFSVPRLAEHFGVGKTTARRAILSGEIPAFRIGGDYRVRLSSVPQQVIDRWSSDKAKAVPFPSGPVVYFLVSVPGYVKIGFTTDVARRIDELQSGSPLPLELVAFVADGCTKIERRYHRRFKDARKSGEWFEITPSILTEITRLQEDKA